MSTLNKVGNLRDLAAAKNRDNTLLKFAAPGNPRTVQLHIRQARRNAVPVVGNTHAADILRSLAAVQHSNQMKTRSAQESQSQEYLSSNVPQLDTRTAPRTLIRLLKGKIENKLVLV